MYPVKRQISARTPAISGSFAISIQKTGKELPAKQAAEKLIFLKGTAFRPYANALK
jgi:hypothetical protein